MPYGKSWKQFALEFKDKFNSDNVTMAAASIAYYLMLAVFPAMIALLSLIAFLPIPDLDKTIMSQLGSALPGDAANMFAGTVNEITQQRQGGLLSVGLLLAIWAASNGMYAIMQQLNNAHDVKETRPFWKARGTALLLTFGMGFLIVTAMSLMLLDTVIRDLVVQWLGPIPGLDLVLTLLRYSIVVAFLMIAFEMTYRFGPPVKNRFRFVSPGSVLAAGLMVAASLGFKLYVENFGKYSATYGSLGAIIVFMLWLSISGIVILVGAELNALVLKSKRGRGSALAAPDHSKEAA